MQGRFLAGSAATPPANRLIIQQHTDDTVHLTMASATLTTRL